MQNQYAFVWLNIIISTFDIERLYFHYLPGLEAHILYCQNKTCLTTMSRALCVILCYNQHESRLFQSMLDKNRIWFVAHLVHCHYMNLIKAQCFGAKQKIYIYITLLDRKCLSRSFRMLKIQYKLILFERIINSLLNFMSCLFLSILVTWPCKFIPVKN